MPAYALYRFVTWYLIIETFINDCEPQTLKTLIVDPDYYWTLKLLTFATW